MKYSIELHPSALEDLHKAGKRNQQIIRGTLALLSVNPRPPEAILLKQHPALRINIGEHRIIYTTSGRKVTVIAILKNLPRAHALHPNWSTTVFEINRATQNDNKAKRKAQVTHADSEIIRDNLAKVIGKSICGYYVSDSKKDAYFILRRETHTQEIVRRELTNRKYELLLIHLSRDGKLLYIHSSRPINFISKIARNIIAEDFSLTLIKGKRVLRIFPTEDVTPINIGLHDISDSNSLYSMYTSRDVTKTVEHQNLPYSTSTHTQFKVADSTRRTVVAASLSGRIWSAGHANNMGEWIEWCEELGRKLKDDTQKTNSLFSKMAFPRELSGPLEEDILAADWPEEIFSQDSPNWEIRCDNHTFPLKACDLLVNRENKNTTILSIAHDDKIRIEYVLQFNMKRKSIDYSVKSKNTATILGNDSEPEPLSDWLNYHKPVLSLYGNKRVTSDDMLLEPAEDLQPYDKNCFTTVNWSDEGIDIRKESQTEEKLAYTIQRYMAKFIIKKHKDLLVLIDDDNSHEAADLVGFAVDKPQNTLTIILVHCKYSSKDYVGSRVEDLYDLCGQAARGAKWGSKGVSELVTHLKQRLEDNKGGHKEYKFEKGKLKDLDKITEYRYEIKFITYIVQPGLSRKKCGTDQLLLIASAEAYFYQKAKGEFNVVCSE
jgi:possible helicase